jgi:signal transduction histidine kinase/ActR/RegA family two-component response regulator
MKPEPAPAVRVPVVRYTPLGVALGALAVLLTLGYGVDRATRARLVAREREQVGLRLSPYSNALTVAINRRVSRLTALKGFVLSARSVQEIDREFPVLGKGLRQNAGGVRALQLVRGGVIRWVDPVKGNELFIGHDLLKDSRAAIARDVRRAMADTQIIVTMPLDLQRAGTGIVAHQHIASRNPAFPDLASVLIDLDTLFAVSSLINGVSGLDVGVMDKNGTLIGPKSGTKPPDAIAVTVSAPDGDWTILAAPTGGWDASVAGQLLALRVGWLLVTLLLSGLAYLIVGRQSQLTAAVESRTMELQRTNAELQHEVREREEAEAALRRREEQLLHAQKMEAMGTLAGGIAHDFNNVLTAIIGFSGLALDRTNDVAAGGDPTGELAGLKEDIQEILHAAEHASLVTNQLLSFSRKSLTKLESIDLGILVRETEVLLARLIGERVRLETRIEPQLPRVHADRGQLTQVLVNLAVNARDAMADGGRLFIEAATVAVDSGGSLSERGIPDGRYVELVVTDTGQGIPQDVLPRIFEPFFTTKGLGKGTGLGLSTVYGIVLRLGGRVLVESEADKGTTFRILFPVYAAVDRAGVPSSRGVKATTNSETILVVEDEAAVRQLASRLLSRLGFDVIVASSGEEALTVSAAHPGRIHLVLTDLVMPGISGRVAAEKLKAQRPGIRVLFMSGYSEEAGMLGGFDGGRATLLGKPFTPEELERCVREVLDSTYGTYPMPSGPRPVSM